MVDWGKASEELCRIAGDAEFKFADGNAPMPGQRASLKAIAARLPRNGVIIADEVGMGKTRLAAVVTKAVIDAGGRVAILVPPGLGFQWSDELRKSHVDGVQPILRSLWQYLKAWEDPANPAPWFEQKAMLISHFFCNWRLGVNAEPWRWALLPELYARWRKVQGGRSPRDYRDNAFLRDDWVRQAAGSIANAINDSPQESSSRLRMADLASQTPWPGALNSGEYANNANLRPSLEKAAGLGLGVFDLVIIDEAHKYRGGGKDGNSILDKLWKNVVLSSPDIRRIALTATPVDLDAVNNWKTTLVRIDAGDDTQTMDAVARYDHSVKRVRQSPQDEKTLDEYVKAARCFESEHHLGKYLLRRDKREIESVRLFSDLSGGEHSDYRSLSDIAVLTTNLSPVWKQAVCAAEALSFATKGMEDQTAKRLRLTLGNGHGIATLIDEILRDAVEDPDDHDIEKNHEPSDNDAKKTQRVGWWKQSIANAFGADGMTAQVSDDALYHHPSILAAIKGIEDVCANGEKVLVFGRFTKPMQALVRLLNAKEMLRCLDANTYWPQEKIHESERAVIQSELLRRGKGESLNQVSERLAQQYRKLENERERFRTRLRNVLGQNLKSLDEKDREGALTVLARPIQEMLDASNRDEDIIDAFNAVVSSASDQDSADSERSEPNDDSTANMLSAEVLNRLGEEFGRTESGFARLMNGNTKPHGRRLLQLAFNRERSNPKVLVAQSVVGREGLNLHEACRTVILLHAEWNPGVVEQQIGRVDRIGSLWEKKLKQAVENSVSAGALPKIEIHPVIFEGTYDEENWKVLRGRWDDLRAQLHGVVITPSTALGVPKDVVEYINQNAPDFSPDRRLSRDPCS